MSKSNKPSNVENGTMNSAHVIILVDIGLLSAAVVGERVVHVSQDSMFARLGTDYEIRSQWFFAILKAMTTDYDLSQWKCNDPL